MTTIIETRDLRRVFSAVDGAHAALDGVSLRIDAGEFVAIMGPSGCGKSTLLHLMGGLDRPTSGEVWFSDERVDALSEAAWAKRRRRDVGYVFQFFNLVGNLSAADNIELPALIAGLGAGNARRRRQELMEQLGITRVARVAPALLSGGERERVSLARALVNRPALLLADEPTGSLDSAATHEVVQLLRQYHAGGQTIVLVTHDARVASVAQRVVRLRDGRLVGETALEDGMQSTRLADLIALEV